MPEKDWLTARDRAVLYVRALGLPAQEGLEIALEALKGARLSVARNDSLNPTSETLRFLRERLAEPPLTAPRRDPKEISHPPLNRGAMVPETLYRSLGRALSLRRPKQRRRASNSAANKRGRPREALQKPWEKAAVWRRGLLLSLVLLTSATVSGFMATLLLRRGYLGLEILLVLLFAVLFAWISIGFWASVFGFLTLVRGKDRFAVPAPPDGEEAPLAPEARTAILIPICNEEVERVFAGLMATYRSLERTGHLELFDFYLLSDTGNPDTWVEEEAAWADSCRSLGRFDKVFYRRRRVNLKRKSGNVADFCRRWGRNYRYMVVFDADSVMTGPTLLLLLREMERNPGIGILQTAPLAVNHDTLFSRLQQFANHVYGPVFAAGLHFWQLGDGQYWGHNAIVRVAPFMRHCALPRLPGDPPLGGDILSHDFVEATLMRRAGWGVWLAYGLGGSFEETPPTLLEELKRDRRWCQGNLQHMRLLFTQGIFPAHRALFLNGAMSYLSALFWFLFLAASTVAAMAEVLVEPNYFPGKFSLFPNWPVWRPDWALILLGATVIILFLPKTLGALDTLVRQRRARGFGGGGRLLASVLAETFFSSLFAPIRMMFHSKFVFLTLLGRKVGWGSQSRGDQGTGWLEALRFHGAEMGLGFLWGGAVFLINPSFFWWLTPILLALVLSVPLSVIFSRTGSGRRFRKWGLFLIPEEIRPPPETVLMRHHLQERHSQPSPLPIARQEGFCRAVVDPSVHQLHLSLLRSERKLSAAVAERRRGFREKALRLGPDALTDAEKSALLYHPASMKALHQAVWSLPDDASAGRWGLRWPGNQPKP